MKLRPQQPTKELTSYQCRQFLAHHVGAALSLGIPSDVCRHIMKEIADIAREAPDGISIPRQTALDSLLSPAARESMPPDADRESRIAAWIANSTSFTVTRMLGAAVGALRFGVSQQLLMATLDDLVQDDVVWVDIERAQARRAAQRSS